LKYPCFFIARRVVQTGVALKLLNVVKHNGFDALR
jgi:hypothetical protein